MKTFFWLLFFNLLLFSCARVGSPVGGDKDTIAPRPIAVNIDSPFVRVPRDFRVLRIQFDEYITLKDIQKNLIISPPIKQIRKILPTAIPTKEIIVEWKDSLQANTTYSFNFGNAIRDNNEGNPLPYYNLAFSTGEKIDDLYISGFLTDGYSVNNTETNKNSKPKIVGLYPHKDSIDYKQKPLYITKAEDDGYYEINYIPKGAYRIIAFEDKNENSIYDAGEEQVGFMKDSLMLNASRSKVDLQLFPSKKTAKYVEAKEIPGGALFLFDGHPKNIHLQPENENLPFRTYHKPYSDSLQVFVDINNEIFTQNTPQNLVYEYSIGEKKGKASLFFRNTKSPVLTLTGEKMIAPKSHFVLKSTMPLDSIDSSVWTLKQDSLQSLPFQAVISPKDATKILISADFLEDKKYTLTLPKGSVQSFFIANDKTHRWDFTVDKISNYGSFTLQLKTNDEKLTYRWIQLLNKEGKIVQEIYTEDRSIQFPILKPDEYTLRILVDEDNDGYWSPSDLDKGILAEPVFIFPKKITVRPLWELVEEWTIE